MTDIRILQRQFERAGKRFRSLAHTIISAGQVYPSKIHGDYEPTPDDCVRNWMWDDEDHYLLRLDGANWDKHAALCELKTLAQKGTSWLLANKDSSGISPIVSATVGSGSGNPLHVWLSVVRHLRPGKAVKMTGAPNGRRAAKKGEPFYSVLEDVFSESALACGRLLAAAGKRCDEE